MLVVTFAVAGPHNCVDVGGTSYVYARTAQGSFVMPAGCPHRGGPLHLADLSPDGRRLVCPWHGGRNSLARIRQQIPAVRRGDTVTAVVPHPPDVEAATCHRPMSAALGG